MCEENSYVTCLVSRIFRYSDKELGMRGSVDEEGVGQQVKDELGLRQASRKESLYVLLGTRSHGAETKP